MIRFLKEGGSSGFRDWKKRKQRHILMKNICENERTIELIDQLDGRKR